MNELGIPLFVFASVMFCWFVFAAAFFFRKKPPETVEARRDPSAKTGIALESIGYAIVWTGQRRWMQPILPVGFVLEVVLGFLTVIIALSSVWLVIASIRTLGKHWTPAARVVEGHTLVTKGPYRIVRHPIYTGMFGLLIATGFAVSLWYALIAAGVIFWIGTMLRIKVEDQLLRDTFGRQFDDYVAQTPPLFPSLFRNRTD